jgi:hypothetical protein
VRVEAPSLEELWIDGVTLVATGSGNDALDVTTVTVVEDRNGDGQRDSGEPVLATGAFAADNGTLQLTGMGLELDPGEETHLLVVYDVTVQSVSSAPQLAALGWLVAVLLPLLVRRRTAVLLLLPLVLAACGGGGGSGCNPAFDPAGAIVTFDVSVPAGGIRAFTSTSDPGSPLPLPPAPVASGTLSVSN